MTDEGLRNCPFCGGEADIDDSSLHHMAFCTKCGAMPDDDNGATLDRTRTQAIEYWNTRANDELIDKLRDHLWEIRNCRATGFQTPFADLIIAKADEALALANKWRKK